MTREDFEENGDGQYEFDDGDVVIAINEDAFDDETIAYAGELLEKYKMKQEQIQDEMLEKGLREFYGEEFEDEEIKESLGQPRIEIIERNDGDPERKYKYWGMLKFLEHELDGEHTIEIEFTDDLALDKVVQING